MNGIQDSHRTGGGHNCSPHLDARLGALQCLLGTNGCHHSKHQVHIGQQLEARVWSLGWGEAEGGTQESCFHLLRENKSLRYPFPGSFLYVSG